ncbi:MAG TPA: nucleotide sugar dehydrogenase, partial [Cryptosporangiaceae bacterium]|nr:nucleotide sugar dehydrogenase [Cryptosporangiaceae bacterium]
MTQAVAAGVRADRPDRVVVVGQGYVGLPVAMRAVEVGYDVVGLDVDRRRVDRLRSGSCYVEDVSDRELVAARAGGRYLASWDYADAAAFRFAVITVPTPLREGSPDLSFIEESVHALAPHLCAGSTVVLESTTYPGTTENLVKPLLEQGSGLRAGVDFFLGYSPERIDPGNRDWTFVTTPKVVSGIDPGSLAAVQGFYDSLVQKTIAVRGTREAEMTKLLENTFRHVNVALVNELALFSHMLGIDVWDAIDAASSKPFGYMRFTPGPGVGGHCLPVDPSYLSWEVKRTLGRTFRFVELANDVNDHMPDYVVQRVIAGLNRHRKAVNGARVLLMGLAYKKNTGDSRESPALRVAELLHALGAEIRAVDAHVEPEWVPDFVTLVALEAGEARS